MAKVKTSCEKTEDHKDIQKIMDQIYELFELNDICISDGTSAMANIILVSFLKTASREDFEDFMKNMNETYNQNSDR